MIQRLMRLFGEFGSILSPLGIFQDVRRSVTRSDFSVCYHPRLYRWWFGAVRSPTEGRGANVRPSSCSDYPSPLALGAKYTFAMDDDLSKLEAPRREALRRWLKGGESCRWS